MNKQVKLASLVLRLGLAAVLAYAAVASLVSPDDWVGYMPRFLTALAPAGVLLKLFSAYELLLALWLLSGKFQRYAGIVTALTMFGIIVSDPKLFGITFRDIAIAGGAVALAILSD